MKVKITYPKVKRKRMEYKKLINIIKWPIIIAIIASAIVNSLIGGKAWSVIVIWSIYMLWKLVLSPDLVEYNRISQFVKFVILSSVLLILIDKFLISGWAVNVVLIILVSSLLIAGILLFTDLERQKQNMQPLLLLIFLAFLISGIGLCIYDGKGRWILMVMGALALVLLITFIIVLKDYLIKELKKIFHTS